MGSARSDWVNSFLAGNRVERACDSYIQRANVGVKGKTSKLDEHVGLVCLGLGHSEVWR